MREVIFYPLTIKTKNGEFQNIITNQTSSQWKKLMTEIKSIDYSLYGLELIESKRYKKEFIKFKVKIHPDWEGTFYDFKEEIDENLFKILNGVLELKKYPSFYKDNLKDGNKIEEFIVIPIYKMPLKEGEVIIYPLTIKTKNGKLQNIVTDQTPSQWKKLMTEIKSLDYPIHGLELIEAKRYKKEFIKFKVRKPLDWEEPNPEVTELIEPKLVKILNWELFHSDHPSFYKDNQKDGNKIEEFILIPI